MKNLNHYFTNKLLKSTISNAKLYKFASDHVKRLKGDADPARFISIYTPTSKALADFSEAFMGKDTSQSMRKSNTMALNALVSGFKAKVRQCEGAVVSQWGYNTPVYQQFFPSGRMEYTSCNKGTAETLLNRLIVACNAHSEELGESYATEFTGMLDAYITASDAQVQTKGNVSVSSVQVAKMRTALSIQLHLNVLFLANLFINDLNEGKAYFDQSLLNGRKRKIVKATDTTGVVSISIIDAETGEPMPNVFANAEGLTINDISDEAGDLNINEVLPGTYTFTFVCEGYTAFIYERAIVVAGQETAIEIRMVKEVK